MEYTNIISTKALHEHLGQPGWVVVDCRFDLSNPSWGFEDYQRGHIPGAIYANLDRDLSSPVTTESGRHPLPAPQEFAARLYAWGITSTTQVVVYDVQGGSYAARLWWMLQAVGYTKSAVLDGNLQRWVDDGYPVEEGVNQPTPAAQTPQVDFNTDFSVSVREVDRIRQDPDYRLIDARAPERYSGEVEPIDTVGGHIPGAVNRHHAENLNPDGLMKSPEVLRAEYQKILGNVAPENVVVYCGSGVTSAHVLLAMNVAGLPGAKLYIGSWSEWIRDPHRPRVLPE